MNFFVLETLGRVTKKWSHFDELMPAVKVFLGLEVICYRVYGVDLCGLRGCLRLFEVEPLDQLWPLEAR